MNKAMILTETSEESADAPNAFSQCCNFLTSFAFLAPEVELCHASRRVPASLAPAAQSSILRQSLSTQPALSALE